MTKNLLLPALLLGASTLAAQTGTAPAHHAATTTHHPVAHLSHCAVPPPALSPKIPPTRAALGCPKVEYALTYIDTKIGTGELAQPRKFYTVHYTGYLTDGTKFDSSYDHPGAQPITFPYGAHRVIPGWDTGFEGMRVGGKRRLFVPYQLAYGETGRPPVIPPKAELIFDVELVSQSDTPPGQPPAPPAGQPGDAGTPPPAGSSGTPPPGSATQPPKPQ
jgi:peptidylprolyl isomerase